jgi:hypothetical protein
MRAGSSRRLVQLRQQRQVVARPEPLTILEVLTSHHNLIRSGAGNGAIAFQHQQFQEWYASHEVVELMRANAKGDNDARVRLRAAIFDQPAWEESIFFAVERVSREDCGVAHALHQALPIDPVAEALKKKSHE